ncbi:hypothetical protein B0H10DRAFT_1965345 [Mycena sp. CBHHK59/15]|nr:hypothetical protein B0H10DRAFT_1965345 [Mycena sp. CBHHK59/15]
MHLNSKKLPSDCVLLVLHPAIRLSYFQSGDWDKDLAKRAKTILEHLYEVYKEEFEEDHPEASSSAAPKVHTTSPSKGIFRRAVARAASGGSTVQNELEVYFSGIYPMADDDDDIYG